MSRKLPPMSLEGFAGCITWLAQTKAGIEPDHTLLTRGVPQGRIKRAEVQKHDDGGYMIAVTFIDQHTGQERNARLFDPSAFLALRLLLLAKTAIRFERTDKGSPELHYVGVFDHIMVLRIIADAGAGQTVKQIGDHHDLRRRNLVITTTEEVREAGKAMGSTHKGRALAIKVAMENFDKRAEQLRKRRLPIDRKQYAWLLEQVFLMLDDKYPLGDLSTAAKGRRS